MSTMTAVIWSENTFMVQINRGDSPLVGTS